jgi:hypothetical protein
MLTSRQRDQRIVGRAARHAHAGALPMGHPGSASRKHERLGEVLVDEPDRIRRRHAGIARQPRQHRIRLCQAVATQAQCPTPSPRHNLPMMLMSGNQQRYGDAGIHRHDIRSYQRRPASMSPNIISSVTTVSLQATSRPVASRSSLAVRPPGVTCTPLPYWETSTTVPGVRPNASRSALGTTMRPTESITASIGIMVPTNSQSAVSTEATPRRARPAPHRRRRHW